MSDEADDATAVTAVFDEDEITLDDISWMDYGVLAIFWILAFVVFLQFFTRYVLNNSLGWTEEIARFLLIAVTFTGSVMAARKNVHIAVEFFYRWIPRGLRRVAQLAIDLTSTAAYAGMVFLCLQLAQRTNQLMVSIEVPKSAVYYYVALCFAGMTLFGAWNTFRHLRDGTSRLIDPADHEGELRGVD